MNLKNQIAPSMLPVALRFRPGCIAQCLTAASSGFSTAYHVKVASKWHHLCWQLACHVDTSNLNAQNLLQSSAAPRPDLQQRLDCQSQGAPMRKCRQKPPPGQSSPKVSTVKFNSAAESKLACATTPSHDGEPCLAPYLTRLDANLSQ